MIPTPANSRRFDLPLPVFAAGVAAALILQIALIASHDYFVDEWQALQIAVQSPNLSEFFANLRYEGHPPLWYLLLRGLAALVGPGRALMAASLLCALTTIAVIAARAPVPRIAKLAIILSEPILFEFGTVARGYSLGVCLVFLALALWQWRRAVWLVLALFPLLDFLFGVLALAFITLRHGEGARLWPVGLGVFAAATILAAWSVLPAPDFVSVYRPVGTMESIARWNMEMAVVAFPVQWSGGPRWDEAWITPLTPALGAAFLYVAYDQTRERWIERLVAVGFPLALLAFMVAVHTLAIRHVMLAAVVLIAVVWRQGARGVVIRPPTALWLALSALCGLATAGFALAQPFDTAPRAVEAIRAMRLENESWLSFPAQHAQGVSALGGIAFEGVERGCRQDFIRWNFRHTLTEPERLRDWLAREAARGGTFYLVSHHQPAPGGPIHHLVTIPPGLDGKVYHLYRIEGAQAGRRAVPRRCVPRTRPLPPLMPA